MQKGLAAVGVVIAGVVVVVVAFTANLFSVAPAFEDLTDGFRDTVMTDEGIAQAESDIGALAAVNDEFPQVAAGLAEVFGTDAAGFQAMMGEQFPAVAGGLEALPSIIDEFNGVIGLIDSQQANFEQADQLPTSSLPATTLPWIIVLIGVLGIAAGVTMLMRGRAGALFAVVLGFVVVVSSLVLSFTPKAGAADDMNEAFKPVYNQELIDGSATALAVVGAMGEQLQTEVVPAVAGQMNQSVEDTMQFIGENFPATGAALQSLPDAMGRFQSLVGTFDAQLENYEDIKDTTLRPIAVIVLGAGAVILILGGWALFGTKED
jgi:hypothetical protein